MEKRRDKNTHYDSIYNGKNLEALSLCNDREVVK